MKKKNFVEQITMERKLLDDVLAPLTQEKMVSVNIVGNWTIKDVIAHITWFDREMVQLLQTRELAGSDLWLLTDDERNVIIYNENKDRPLDEVMAESNTIFQQLELEIMKLEDVDLVDPARFKQMPLDWVPWEILEGSTNRHYKDHREGIEEWLEKNEE